MTAKRVGKACRRFKIQSTQLLAQSHMIFGFEGKGAGFAPDPDLHVVVFAVALGHTSIRHIGYVGQESVQLFLENPELVLCR